MCERKSTKLVRESYAQEGRLRTRQPTSTILYLSLSRAPGFGSEDGDGERVRGCDCTTPMRQKGKTTREVLAIEN